MLEFFGTTQKTDPITFRMDSRINDQIEKIQSKGNYSRTHVLNKLLEIGIKQVNSSN